MSFGSLVGMTCRSTLPAGLRHTLIGLLSLLDDTEGEATISAIASRTGRNDGTTRGDVAKLEQMGIVRRSGDLGRTWRYEVVEAVLATHTPPGNHTPPETRRGMETDRGPLRETIGDPSGNPQGSTRNRNACVLAPSLSFPDQSSSRGRAHAREEAPPATPTTTRHPIEGEPCKPHVHTGEVFVEAPALRQPSPEEMGQLMSAWAVAMGEAPKPAEYKLLLRWWRQTDGDIPRIRFALSRVAEQHFDNLRDVDRYASRIVQTATAGEVARNYGPAPEQRPEVRQTERERRAPLTPEELDRQRPHWAKLKEILGETPPDPLAAIRARAARNFSESMQ